jgi:nitroreductase/NAD-dependent dihydropyrimidine dehydrogenase PreA subunit
MNQLKFSVNAEKCVQCDACIKDCPSENIQLKEAKPGMAEDGCFECQHCLAVCPTGALSIFGLKPENSLPLLNGSIPSYQQMKTLVRGRRSVRQFRDEDVPATLIDDLLADLAHAPTGGNTRDLAFSLVPNRKAMGTLRERIIKTIKAGQESVGVQNGFIADIATAYYNGGKDMLFWGAPHLLIVSPGEKTICGHEDTVIALSYFELLAQSANLGATWCGVLKFIADMFPETYKLLGLAPDTYFYAMMFGKPAVAYVRTVQRDSVAQIRRIDLA